MEELEGCQNSKCCNNDRFKHLLDDNNKLRDSESYLIKMLTNKIMLDYDIDTVLKTELNDTRLEVVSLIDCISELNKERDELISWLEYELNRYDKDGFVTEIRIGYMDGFKYVVDLIENFHKTEGEKLNLSFEEFVILESLLDYIKKCR